MKPFRVGCSMARRGDSIYFPVTVDIGSVHCKDHLPTDVTDLKLGDPNEYTEDMCDNDAEVRFN